MNDDVQIAEQFGQFIAGGDYAAAHKLLNREMQKLYLSEALKRKFERMTAYEPGPIREVKVMDEFVLYDWPAKRVGDIASVYVSLTGDGYVEAVSVILAREDGATRIRELEWGRP